MEYENLYNDKRLKGGELSLNNKIIRITKIEELPETKSFIPYREIFKFYNEPEKINYGGVYTITNKNEGMQAIFAVKDREIKLCDKILCNEEKRTGISIPREECGEALKNFIITNELNISSKLKNKKILDIAREAIKEREERRAEAESIKIAKEQNLDISSNTSQEEIYEVLNGKVPKKKTQINNYKITRIKDNKTYEAMHMLSGKCPQPGCEKFIKDENKSMYCLHSEMGLPHAFIFIEEKEIIGVSYSMNHKRIAHYYDDLVNFIMENEFNISETRNESLIADYVEGEGFPEDKLALSSKLVFFNKLAVMRKNGEKEVLNVPIKRFNSYIESGDIIYSDIDLHSTGITYEDLPDFSEIKIKGDIDLSDNINLRSPEERYPDNPKKNVVKIANKLPRFCGGDLNCSKTKIRAYPSSMKIGGNFNVSNSSAQIIIGDKIEVGGDFNATEANFKKKPKVIPFEGHRGCDFYEGNPCYEQLRISREPHSVLEEIEASRLGKIL